MPPFAEYMSERVPTCVRESTLAPRHAMSACGGARFYVCYLGGAQSTQTLSAAGSVLVHV